MKVSEKCCHSGLQSLVPVRLGKRNTVVRWKFGVLPGKPQAVLDSAVLLRVRDQLSFT